ncbi:MAG: hypothetical protein C4345_00740 [Chloroflexota bacterium]
MSEIDILFLVDRLESLINAGQRVPFTNKIMIDEKECLDIIDQMRIVVPEEIKQARRVSQDRDRITAQAQAEAERIIKQAQAAAEAVKLDASTITTYDDLFGRIVESMPAQYRRSYPDLRLYVPVKHRDGYQRALAARGTGLGDQATMTNLATQLAFRGIPLREVPLMSGTSNVNGASVDYSKFALLTNPQNIVVGFHRRVRVERFRDPREGSMSIVVTARADVKLADPNGVVLAHSIAL